MYVKIFLHNHRKCQKAHSGIVSSRQGPGQARTLARRLYKKRTELSFSLENPIRFHFFYISGSVCRQHFLRNVPRMIRDTFQRHKRVKVNDSRVCITLIIGKTLHMFRSETDLQIVRLTFFLDDFHRLSLSFSVNASTAYLKLSAQVSIISRISFVPISVNTALRSVSVSANSEIFSQ